MTSNVGKIMLLIDEYQDVQKARGGGGGANTKTNVLRCCCGSGSLTAPQMQENSQSHSEISHTWLLQERDNIILPRGLPVAFFVFIKLVAA